MNSKFVTELMVTDPDTGSSVEIAVFKHENGGMFAIDSSFINQVLDDEDCVIPDPFSDIKRPKKLHLNE